MMTRVSAYESFKERLFSGELSPGQFVTQKELAELAGVPLGAAREAIQKLEHEALLKVHPQRGIQVTDITIRFIRNAFNLRKVLERDAIRNFADGTHAVEAREILEETRTILQLATDKTSDAVLERAVEIDWHTHDVVIDALNNELLTEVYQINVARTRLIKANLKLTHERVFGALNEHIRILECCIAEDPEGAVEAMDHHIDTAMNRAMQGV